ncbi:MAG: two-component system sensor histidine kinase [Phycisphaerales bacterium]|nr:two-component system sensor histidine kinase [Phycisphaerales bacterium]
MTTAPTTISPATVATPPPPDPARRVEELGRIILAYSEVTERLQVSHDQLTRTVEVLTRELGEKNRLLERRNRLAALGEMAAGLAHEIRNPLGGIQLYASLLAGDLADRPDSLGVVRKIAAGVKRLDALVGQVLQFSREMRATLADADLAVVVAQAVEDAARTLQERGVTCDVDGPPELPATFDALLIGQVVLNLILNAAEAMDGGGTVTVSFCPALPTGHTGGTGRPGSPEPKQFSLAVHDTGPGIPPDVLDKVFNPFFTTKDTGTGLGLSIVHRIVEAHDGTITVVNADGGGARFEIRV